MDKEQRIQHLQGEVNRLNNVIAERDWTIDRYKKALKEIAGAEPIPLMAETARGIAQEALKDD